MIGTMSADKIRNVDDNQSFEDRVFARFDAIDAWRSSVDEWRESTDRRFEGVQSRLQALELQAEKRELDTKPIWERALSEIRDVKDGLAELTRKIDVLSHDIVSVRADQLRLDTRLDKLEPKPA